MEISDAEWEVMRVVWATKETTSANIIDVLAKKMSWKASTTKTLISRLVQKEMLLADKTGHKFLYEANISENEAVQLKLEALVEQLCQKKVGESLNQLIEHVTLSQADITSLQTLLNKKIKNAPETINCDCVAGQCTCHIGF